MSRLVFHSFFVNDAWLAFGSTSSRQKTGKLCWMWRRLSTRDRQPEVMDQPDLDRRRHVQALRGLARINQLSRSTNILWQAMNREVRATGGLPLTVLDV